MIERRLRDDKGNFTEAMVVAFHSCPDVKRVVKDCMEIATTESQSSMEDNSARSSFGVTGQRERLDSNSTHDSKGYWGAGIARVISDKVLSKSVSSVADKVLACTACVRTFCATLSPAQGLETFCRTLCAQKEGTR